MNSQRLLWIGFLLTASFMAVVYWIAIQEVCFFQDDQKKVCLSNVQAFLQSPPNEKGDTLAGLAGGLAFLWIIVTVLLQGHELSEQRKIFQEQAKSTEKIEETQKLQTETLEKQTAILASELQMQAERRHDGYVSILIEELEKIVAKTPDHFDTWEFEGDFIGEGPEAKRKSIKLFGHRHDSEESFLQFAGAATEIFMLHSGQSVFLSSGTARLKRAPEKNFYIQKIKSTLDRIYEEEESCTPYQRAKLGQAGLSEFRKWFDFVYDTEELWGGVTE